MTTVFCGTPDALVRGGSDTKLERESSVLPVGGMHRGHARPERLPGQQIPVNLDPAQIDGKFFSGFSRAMKPAGARNLAASDLLQRAGGAPAALCLCRLLPVESLETRAPDGVPCIFVGQRPIKMSRSPGHPRRGRSATELATKRSCHRRGGPFDCSGQARASAAP